jgi:hypothetical protein
MKLNLGSGFQRLEGFVSVDVSEHFQPDVVVDLAREVWPWPEHSVSEAAFHFSLEQIPRAIEELRHVIRELYRVCAPGAKVSIHTIHPRHDEFVMNPLCRMPISPEFLQLLSIDMNLQRIGQGQTHSNLALEWQVNFKTVRTKFILAADLESEFGDLQANEAFLRRRMRFENNICHMVEIELEAVKI